VPDTQLALVTDWFDIFLSHCSLRSYLVYVSNRHRVMC